MIDIRPTPLPGLVALKPRRFADARGFFSESWNRKTLRAAGLDLPEFVQDNHSFSTVAGTIRGLHYQSPPHAQGKLVRCGRGRIRDVAVDARRGSPTYGQWFAQELSFDNGWQLWIPAGFLHGFVTHEPDSEIIYKCTDHYAPEADSAVRYDSLDIDWGTKTPVLSEKDTRAPAFADWVSPFEWTAQ